jgi:hypothetical protein
MKHEILEEVWRVRDEISAECGHDLKKLAAMLRREEVKYGARLALPPRSARSHRGTAVNPERKPEVASVSVIDFPSEYIDPKARLLGGKRCVRGSPRDHPQESLRRDLGAFGLPPGPALRQKF